MWSNLYWYYEIRGDHAYSQQLPAHLVLKVLKDTGVLLEKGGQSLCNIEDFPWISVTAVDSRDGNYGRSKDFNSRVVNLITVVGSKEDPVYKKKYVDLLIDIAEKLNWELIEEGGSDDGEDLVLRTVLHQ